MKLGSFFDGIGAFPLSAMRYGIIPVWASEIEPAAISITQRHFPDMKHIGDITELNGAEIEPVDIITGGVPCQDWSVAGKRAGIEGKRSGLFFDWIRVINEMLKATNNEYPKYVIFENVPGLLSSNDGEDFRIVMTELQNLGDGFLLDVDILDAQYMGVPQRRRRVFVVALNSKMIERWDEYDLTEGLANTDSSGQFMFNFGNAEWGDRNQRLRACRVAVEQRIRAISSQKVQPQSESVSRDSQTCGEAREETTGSVGDCIEESDSNVTKATGFNGWRSITGNIEYVEEVSPCVQPKMPPNILFENHGQDCRVTGPHEVAPTVSQKFGTGGNNTPLVISGGGGVVGLDAELNADFEKIGTLKAQNHEASVLCMATQQGGAEIAVDLCPTITAAAGMSGNNQPVVCIEGSGARPSHHGDGYAETETMYTLNTVERHAVAYAVTIDCRNDTVNEEMSATIQAKGDGGHSLNYINPVAVLGSGKEVAGTLTAHQGKSHFHGCQEAFSGDYHVVHGNNSVVRRLTPLERERLMAFPDGWTEYGLDNNNKKVKISDSARYRTLGNSIATVCLDYIFEQIVKIENYPGNV